MKTLENTATRLVMEDTPYLLRILLIGLTAALLILGVFFEPIFERLSTFSTEGQTGTDGWAMARWIILASAVIPIGIYALVIKTRRLTLDLMSGKILLERRGVFGHGASEYPIAGLEGVGLQYSYAASSSRTSRAVLDFGATREPVPLKPYYQSGKAPSRVATQINEWVLKHRDELEPQIKDG